MPPEFQLLLCCARLQLTPEHTARITSLLGDGLDWASLRRAAGRHGMLPLLYWHLDRIDTAAIPQDFLSDLRDHFQINAKRNLFLTGELIKLLQLFESHGVPAVAFKGPLQAAVLYHNIALREFLDLDILVRRDDLPKVASLLASQSYEPQPQLPPAQEAFYLRTHCERNFVRADGKSCIDLHWAITSDLFPYPVNTNNLLRRLREASLGGASVKTLDVTDLFLILCVHASKDAFGRLESLCAIGEMVGTGGVDWPRLMLSASNLRCERRLLTGLSLVHNLLGILPPEEILERMQADVAVRGTVELARTRLLSDGSSSRSVLGQSYWKFKILDRRRDALRAVLKAGALPTLPDWGGRSLPAPLFFLYYLRRFVRMLAKHALNPFKG